MSGNPEISDLNLPPDYCSLLGSRAWERLHPDIQMRFSPEHAHRPVTYRGVMEQIYLSFAGKLLAHLCRLIGTPIALYSGTNIPIDVNVYPDKTLQGMTWDRYYHYPDKKLNRVKSTKCIQKDNRLIEVVGFGFGMYLNVYEKHRAIHFESTRYFFQLWQLRVPLPGLLTPGKTLVRQAVITDGSFEFRLRVVHPLLGRVFEQCGYFREVG